MVTVGSSNMAAGMSNDVFVTGAGGVAALDSPQMSQTKLEIRGIVAEIAELSATDVPQAEFIEAVLPRICSAMGASSAALWQCHIDSRIELLGQFRLPELLSPSDDPDIESTEQKGHNEILACIAAEGSAVLVPPKSIQVAAHRPANPLDECLLVVPIKIDDRFEMLLEVIQPASGGPAAQRGYLRFVAQMADLMADYLRRARLHHYAQQAAYTRTLQQCLLAISSAHDKKTQAQQTATSLAQLLDAELVILAVPRQLLLWRRGWRVVGVSHLPSFDSRSEIVLAAERLLASHPSDGSNRLAVVSTDQLVADESSDEMQGHTDAARLANELREQLQCGYLTRLSINDSRYQALIALDGSTDLAEASQRANELADAFGPLLDHAHAGLAKPAPAASLAASSTPVGRITRKRIERLVVRTSTLLLALAIVFFPAPDNIATVAVLESAHKELYYAPSAATIDEVFVESH